MAQAKGGKKGRKIGRCRNSQSQQSYNASMRWERNKRRRVDKESARQSLCKTVQSAAGTYAGAKKRVRDVQRRIRKLRAA